VTLTRDTITEYQQRYGLSYHVPHALDAAEIVGLRDKIVVEIGGSLPERFVRDAFGVRGWIAIEELSYWQEIEASGGVQGSPPGAVARRLDTATAADIESGYGVFAGRIEALPAALDGRFDAAFSIAAFEHINTLALTLDGAWRALRPGGCLFSLFSPIWSAHDGHHLPSIRDRSGRGFDFTNAPVPPWGHLLLRPPELFGHLLAHTDRQTAAEMVYYIYHSPHINRLFTEDYIAYCRASPFAVERCDLVFPLAPPPDIQRELERRHPGRTHFTNGGLLVVLRKPGGTS
jgi:SAM-dependent methyltransferase